MKRSRAVQEKLTEISYQEVENRSVHLGFSSFAKAVNLCDVFQFERSHQRSRLNSRESVMTASSSSSMDELADDFSDLFHSSGSPCFTCSAEPFLLPWNITSAKTIVL